MTRWTWDTWWFSPWRWSRADPERALVLTENRGQTVSCTWQRRSKHAHHCLYLCGGHWAAMLAGSSVLSLVPLKWRRSFKIKHILGSEMLPPRWHCLLMNEMSFRWRILLYWDSTLVLSFEKSCLIVNHTPKWNFYSYLLEIRLTLVFGNILVKRKVCWKYCANIYKVMSI